MSRTIKPMDCPFCGGQCIAAKVMNTQESHQVFCTYCQARQEVHKDRVTAIAAWNKRVIVTDQKTAAYLLPDEWITISAAVFNKAPIWLRTKWLDAGAIPLYEHPTA